MFNLIFLMFCLNAVNANDATAIEATTVGAIQGPLIIDMHDTVENVTVYGGNRLRLDCVAVDTIPEWKVSNELLRRPTTLNYYGRLTTMTWRYSPRYLVTLEIQPDNTTYSLVVMTTYVGLTGSYTCANRTVNLRVLPNITNVEPIHVRKTIFTGDNGVIAIVPVGSRLIYIPFANITRQRDALRNRRIRKVKVGSLIYYSLYNAEPSDTGYYVYVQKRPMYALYANNVYVVNIRKNDHH